MVITGLPATATTMSPSSIRPVGVSRAPLQAGPLGRTAARDLADDQPFDAPPSGHGIGHKRDAETGANELSVLDQFRHDAVDRIHRHREADPCIGPARTDDLRIDPDQAARAVEERSAGIARIDGGIGLDDAFDRPVRQGLDRPPEGAHDARW